MSRDRIDPYDRSAVDAMASDAELADLAQRFFLKTCEHRYSYNFSWLGRPVIQYPQDLIATQEIIWTVKPELIIETGIAHGGSLVFYASMLELIGGPGSVLGIDVEIRRHNRTAIEAHALARRIAMVEGSSVDEHIAKYVHARARDVTGHIMVVLDSNHTHAHVRRELDLYTPLVKDGSYCIVFDTGIERMPQSAFGDRPWRPGDSPHTAVQAFLRECDRFVVDDAIDKKLLVSAAPGGYLRCIKN